MHEPPWLEDGGYRISDSMLVTPDGARPFTSYPRALADVVIPCEPSPLDPKAGLSCS